MEQVVAECNSVELVAVVQICLLSCRLLDVHRPTLNALASRIGERPLIGKILHTLVKFLSSNNTPECSKVLDIMLEILEKYNGEVSLEWIVIC